MKLQPRRGFAIAIFAMASGAVCAASGMNASAGQRNNETKQAVKIAVRVVKSTPDQARRHPRLEELLKAGGKLMAAPTVSTLDGMDATIETSESVPYVLDGLHQSSPPRTGMVRTGLKIHAVPHIEADRSIRVDLEADNTELAPSGAPATVKHGISNSRALPTGATVLFGTWEEGKKVVSVFVKAD